MLALLITLLCSTVPLSPAVFHPLKMSMARLEVDEDEQATLDIRIFLDDLSEVLSKEYSLPEVDFTNHVTATATRSILASYLAASLRFVRGEAEARFVLDSYNLTEDGLALEAQLNADLSQLPAGESWFHNELFIGYFAQQTNHLRYRGVRYRFTIRQTRVPIGE